MVKPFLLFGFDRESRVLRRNGFFEKRVILVGYLLV